MLQIGADIYCDSKMCAQVLEQLHPEPTLFPGDVATIWGLARWAETSFLMAVLAYFGMGGLFDEAFVADRKKMVPTLDIEKVKPIAPAKLLQLAQNLERLERQLADGRAFLLGAAPSLADLAAYHTHAFLKGTGDCGAARAPSRPAPWLARVAAIGHGDRKGSSTRPTRSRSRTTRRRCPTRACRRAARRLRLRRPRRRAAREIGSGPIPGVLVPPTCTRRDPAHSERAG
jgi:glutathione S-transferase